MKLVYRKRKETAKRNEDKLLIEQQRERIEELREQNRELGGIVNEYRSREKEITDALEFAKKKSEEYVAIAKVKFALECERLNVFRTKLEKFRSKEELLRAYDDAYGEIREWRDDLEKSISGDYGSAMKDYVEEKERLKDDHSLDYGAIARSECSELNETNKISEEELRELLDQI